jgi:hypothetical protein
MPVRIGRPDLSPKHTYPTAPSLPFVPGLKGEFNGPEYAAVVGLVIYGSASAFESAVWRSGDSLMNKMTGFFSNIIGKKK